MLLKNTEKLEEIVDKADFLEAALTDKLNNLEKLLTDKNYKKLENLEQFLQKIKELLEQTEEIKSDIAGLASEIRISEQFVQGEMFAVLDKIKKINKKFEQEIELRLAEILDKKFADITDKNIKKYLKYTVDVFNTFKNILHRDKEIIEQTAEEIEQKLENITEKMYRIERKTEDVRFSKIQKITTILLIISVFMLSFASFSLYKNNNYLKIQNRQIEKALIILNKNQKNILQLLLKH